MSLVALVDSLSERIAQEINAVRAEMIALVTSGPNANATSTNLVAFSGGTAVLDPSTPIVDGGSA